MFQRLLGVLTGDEGGDCGGSDMCGWERRGRCCCSKVLLCLGSRAASVVTEASEEVGGGQGPWTEANGGKTTSSLAPAVQKHQLPEGNAASQHSSDDPSTRYERRMNPSSEYSFTPPSSPLLFEPRPDFRVAGGGEEIVVHFLTN